jgi:RNA recognition motif-containing protein
MERLYVDNLPQQASKEELREWFARGGFGVDRVNIIRDRYSGASRGFGFVETADDEEALRAMLILNGKDFLGCALLVSEARPPRKGRRR